MRRLLRGHISWVQLKNTMWALFGLLGPSVLQLLYTIVAARTLSPTEFGYLTVCTSVGLIMMSLSGFGSGGLVLRQTSRQHDKAGDFLGQSISLTLLSAPLVMAVSIAIMFFVSSPGLPFWLALCIAFSEIVSWRIAMTCQQVFIGFGQLFNTAVVGMFIPLGRLLAALAILLFVPSQDLVSFGLAYGISTFLMMLLSLHFTLRRTGRLTFKLWPFDVAGGFSFALTTFSAAVQVESDKLILSFFASPSDVGVYAVAARLMDGLYAPTRALKQTLQSRLHKAGAGGSIEVIHIAISIVPLLVAYGLLAWGALALGAPLLVWVFGKEYELLAHILPLLGALPLLRSFAEVGSELFLASDRSGFQSSVQISTTIFRVLVSIVLIGAWLLDGAVAAALLSAFVVGAVYWGVALVLLRRSKRRGQGQPQDESGPDKGGLNG